jgi:hypothetical protein
MAADAARDTTTQSTNWAAQQSTASGNTVHVDDNAIAAPTSTTTFAAGR